jgi:hypothetical protein
MTPIERRSIDYSELEGAMAHLELTILDTRRRLDMLARAGVTQDRMDLAERGSGSGQAAAKTDDLPGRAGDTIGIQAALCLCGIGGSGPGT